MCHAFKLQAKTRKRFSKAHIGRGFTEKKKEVDADEDLQGPDTDVLLSSDSDKGNTNVSDDKDDEYFPHTP